MSDERIHVLRDILLELHHGASPESVQERFDATFAGVSAIEISLMEHELMNSDAGVTFEDVMELCDVHANLFKNAVQGVEVADTDHSGHPVQIFKQENLALRAAMMRVRRLLDNYETTEDPEMIQEIHKGLLRQLGLVGQFDRHYRRKEELMFPIMEKYGHDSPPKVMWGVDDQIRDLFAKALDAAKKLPDSSISEVKERFETFAQEFEAMIFKEESILLMILLEAFTQDDWLSIAEESDAYGYAIILPSEKWVPKRVDFKEEASKESEGSTEPLPSSKGDEHRQVIETPEGQLTITFTPKKKEESFDRKQPQAFGHGFLSVEQANLILNQLPMESCVTRQNTWKRSKRSCWGFVKEKKTSMKCGSNPNHVGNLSMSPMQQCMMKLENFKVSWNMFKISNPIGKSIRIFTEEWSKNELRNRVYEGV